jgi:hypothetical protein
MEQLLMILTTLVRACDQDQRADFPIRWVTGYAAKASTTSRPIAVFVILRLTTNADLMFSVYTEGSSISFIISSAARTMEAISIALDIPLPNLLDTTDLDPKTLNELGRRPGSAKSSRRLSALLHSDDRLPSLPGVSLG